MRKILYTIFLGSASLLTLETSAQRIKTDKQIDDNKEVNTAQKTPVKMIEYLVGDWKIDKILSGKKDVTETKGGGNQTLTFTSDARYIMRSGNEKIDSGSYRMNEQIGSLYLESESDEKPREWKTEFISGGMILTPKQVSPQKANLRYFYIRNTPASAKEN